MNVESILLPFDAELLPARKLTAGNLTCLYEKGNLRYICIGGHEVLRRIYTAVRDESWNTAPCEISDEKVEESEGRFSIRYTALYNLNRISYKAEIQIAVSENSVSFSMHGGALSDFQRNRIGICVLHPIQECAGKTAIITHPNGTSTEATFPEMISPHQPFLNVQGMQWQVGLGLSATLQFEGDVFETEDQRNWTDYSYKTYSTPQELPKPVWVRKGDSIEQKVTLVITQTADAFAAGQKEKSVIEVKRPFPKIGYERATGSPHLTATDLELLKQIPFDHYRVVLRFATDEWQSELFVALSEAKALGLSLELVGFFTVSAESEAKKLVECLLNAAPLVCSLLVLLEGEAVTPPALLQKLHSILLPLFPALKIGYGTDGFFAELNRNRPIGSLPFHFVSFGLTPQVHATDARTLMENLASQDSIIKQIRSFAEGKEIFVSPVTFKIRDEHSSNMDEDPRMYTSFGAAWTLLAIKNLAAANRLTFYRASGYGGVLNRTESPEKTPLFQVLKQLKEFRPKWVTGGNDGCSVLFENKTGEQLRFVLNGEWP